MFVYVVIQLITHGFVLQTYYRRGRIIDKYFDNNPIFWGQVQQVYDLLGPDGMSSDETDNELGPNGLKTVTRVARVWLSGAVSSMWDQIEHYHHDREGPKQGNRAFGRTFAPKNTSDSKALCGLPRNYYNSLWWTSLIPVDQHCLTPVDEVPLPDLTMYVAFGSEFILAYSHLTLPSSASRAVCQVLPLQSNDAQ
jgi:hypothetical protein